MQRSFDGVLTVGDCNDRKTLGAALNRTCRFRASHEKMPYRSSSDGEDLLMA